MDVLSSQANIAGYRAVLIAAQALPKMFPLMTTAAGTIAPARVFVVGAGVAGLSAIATARRLGAVVEAYDVRDAAKEEVQSLGARFVELPLDTGQEGPGSGAYATAMSDEALARQRELMLKTVAGSDVVITTAQVQGAKAPVLITAEMVEAMSPGLGGGGPGRRAGRQRRAQPARQDGRRRRRDRHRPGRRPLERAAPREPDVRQERRRTSWRCSCAKDGR